MIGPNDVGMFVPSVPNPRKQRLVWKGRLSLLDLVVAIPLLIVWLVLLLLANMPWWMCLLTLVADVLLILILIWPLSALGKEKLYIYFCRYFAYLIGVNFYRSENWNPTDNTLKAQEGLLEADKPKTSNLTSEPPQTRKNELKTKRKVKS